MADVVITPASGLIDFQNTSGISSATIQLDGTGNLNISSSAGDIQIGDTASDVYIGDGVNNVDIVFEQDGEIRGLTGKTITLGQSDSFIAFAGDVTGDVDFTGGLNVSGVSTFQGNVDLGTDDKIVLGDSGGLEIFSGGSNSIIDQVGSGDLILRTTSLGDDIILRATDDIFIQVAGSENSITCNSNSSVDLYYNNSKKLETTTDGFKVLNGTSETAVISGPQNIVLDPSPDDVATIVTGNISGANVTTITGISTANIAVGNLIQEVDGIISTGTTVTSVGVSQVGISKTSLGSATNQEFTFANQTPTGIVRIKGDLYVDGTQTTINSTTLEVHDKLVSIAKSATNATQADGAGLEINGASATLTYASTGDKWVFNKAPYYSTDRLLTTADEGTGNSLDADTVDGYHSYQGSIRDARNDGDVTPTNFTGNAFDFRFTDDIAGSTRTWDSVLTMKGWSGSGYRVWQLMGNASTSGDTDTNLYFREGIGSSWGSLQKIWTSGNDGTGSGLDADAVDGIQASSFLRSDAADTGTGLITLTNGLNVTGGNVGIGTDNPATALEIYTADPILTIRDTSTSITNANATLRLAETNASGTLDNYWDIVADTTAENWGFTIKEGTTTRLAIQPVTGNIGINTTAPGSTLSVGGTITELYDGTYWNVVTQADVGYGASQVPLNQYLGQLAFLDDYHPNGLRRDGGGSDDVVVGAGGSVGIGTTNPNEELHVLGAAVISSDTATLGDDYSTLTIGERPAGDGYASLTFKNDTNALSAKIDGTSAGINIWGNKNSIDGDRFVWNGASTTEYVALRPRGQDVLRAQHDGTNGRVGIGTDNPSGPLHIDAPDGYVSVNASGTNDYTGFRLRDNNSDKGWLGLAGIADHFTNGSANGDIILRAENNLLFAAGGNTTRIYVKSDGNIGINTTSPTADLDVNGEIKTIDINVASDINLKTNVKSIQDPLEKVFQIRGVTFDWKSSHKSSAGVIAQEVEKVLPQLVNGEGTKTVNYNGLIGLLIEAVKAQQEEIDMLKERLK